jgi:hypothetical protein
MHCNTKDGVNCPDWTQFLDPLWLHSSYGRGGSPSNPDLLTETPECLPDIHEGPLNLAESNALSW